MFQQVVDATMRDINFYGLPKTVESTLRKRVQKYKSVSKLKGNLNEI
jgi:hypothetical protein